jgi:hypothetical protein
MRHAITTISKMEACHPEPSWTIAKSLNVPVAKVRDLLRHFLGAQLHVLYG